MALPIDDQLAIHALYARYCHAIDDGDGPAFAACFTADGAFDTGFGDPIVGPEALAGFVDAVTSGIPGIRHQATNILIEPPGEPVDGDSPGDRATGRAYLYSYTTDEAGHRVVATGRYADTLRKVDGAWRFDVRRFVADTAP